MPTDIEASLSLLEKAMQAVKESTCDLLLASAKRLNSELCVPEYKSLWIEKWLLENKDRSKQDG